MCSCTLSVPPTHRHSLLVGARTAVSYIDRTSQAKPLLHGLATGAGVEHQRGEEEPRRTYSETTPPPPPSQRRMETYPRHTRTKSMTYTTSRQETYGLRHLVTPSGPSEAEETAGGGDERPTFAF
jgi:hypothetical protein